MRGGLASLVAAPLTQAKGEMAALPESSGPQGRTRPMSFSIVAGCVATLRR